MVGNELEEKTEVHTVVFWVRGGATIASMGSWEYWAVWTVICCFPA